MRLGVTGIDHVRLAVGDLEASRLAWTRLGFMLSPRGAHLGRATSDDAILCAQGAVRLFGSPSATARGARSTVVWAVSDMTAAEAALRELGLPLAAPYEVVRQSELPEASVVERFTVLNLPPAATPGLTGALCRTVPPA